MRQKGIEATRQDQTSSRHNYFARKPSTMFPWRAVILINKASGKPIYLQVVDSIIAEIHAGRLRPGQKLPGARTLGELLGLNRKTIVAAMDELNSQGWIESFVHKGTFV